MPKVSVIIPAYNSMSYLPETLDSVLGQTFTDFDVLIVNDGSSDNIVEWASGIKDPRVRLISQENKGLPGARNTGIAESRGEYIAFLDADDLWESTKLEKQVKCLDTHAEIGLVHTWMLLVDEHGNSTGRVLTSDAEGDAWEQVIQKNLIACPSVIVRRCCFEAVGVFDERCKAIEDWDMWIRIAVQYPFAVIKEPLSYYRQLSTSMSKNCQVMEQAFHLVIEKAFTSTPPELSYLKKRSYGHANLCLSWKALQSTTKDLKLAVHYYNQALMHDPQLRYSQEYIRLSLAILMMRWFGADIYGKILRLAYSVRRRFPLNVR